MDGWFVYAFLAASFFLSLSFRLVHEILTYWDVEFLIFKKENRQRDYVLLLAASYTFLWYSISLSFTIYNKWILQQWTGGFDYPILITTIHMTVKFIITRFWRCSPFGEHVKLLPWHTFYTIVIPIGVLTAMDVVMSNEAIVYLPLSIYTIIKASALIFTYLWGILFGVEKLKANISLAVILITIGISIAVTTSGKLSVVGLLFGLCSAASGALRWVLLQVLSDMEGKKKHAMKTLYRFSPLSALSIIPFALALDVPRLFNSPVSQNYELLSSTVGLLVAGGLISFVLIIAEVLLLQVTSSLTMCVLGEIKEVIQITIAMILYKDHVNARNIVGIALSIVASYYYQIATMQNNAEAVIVQRKREDSIVLHEIVPLKTSHSNVQLEVGESEDTWDSL